MHRLPRILFACLLMMGALWALVAFGEAPILAAMQTLLPTTLIALVWMGLLVLCGLAVFGVSTLALGGLRPQELLGALKRDPAPSIKDQAEDGADA
ncbi:MAG TPA: hypothetical protein DIW38_07435 [Oceanicaulis sp.]|nr:hypothetical protein [Oceanicaulis sp.]